MLSHTCLAGNIFLLFQSWGRWCIITTWLHCNPNWFCLPSIKTQQTLVKSDGTAHHHGIIFWLKTQYPSVTEHKERASASGDEHGSAVQLSSFESQVYHFLALWPYAIHWLSGSISCPPCELDKFLLERQWFSLLASHANHVRGFKASGAQAPFPAIWILCFEWDQNEYVSLCPPSAVQNLRTTIQTSLFKEWSQDERHHQGAC